MFLSHNEQKHLRPEIENNCGVIFLILGLNFFLEKVVLIVSTSYTVFSVLAFSSSFSSLFFTNSNFFGLKVLGELHTIRKLQRNGQKVTFRLKVFFCFPVSIYFCPVSIFSEDIYLIKREHHTLSLHDFFYIDLLFWLKA